MAHPSATPLAADRASALPYPGVGQRVAHTVLRFARLKPLGTFGAIIVLVMIVVALLAPILAHFDPIDASASRRLFPPSYDYWMGTDGAGYDVYSRIVYGARVSLYVALVAVALCIAIASVVGLLTAYFGGIVDLLLQRVVDAVMSFPWLILLLTIMFLLGTSTTNVGIALGLLNGIRYTRVVRAAVLSVKENQYFDAAKAIGCSQVRIMVHHVLPNVTAPIIVIASVSWGAVILSESSLSFLGFGVPPPEPSWGGMLSGDSRKFFEVAPWIAIFPGLAISLTVFGFNMLGDALRDVLDPRLRAR
ncbi:MAG: ABC transporter permease [Chloroflexi bacterium]|nr:ABC transporter permease [Chloroflexota bacterium]